MVYKDPVFGLYPIISPRDFSRLKEIVGNYEAEGISGPGCRLEPETISSLSRQELMNEVDLYKKALLEDYEYIKFREKDPEVMRGWRKALADLGKIHSRLKVKTGGPRHKKVAEELLSSRSSTGLLNAFIDLGVITRSDVLPESVEDLLNMIQEAEDILKERKDISSKLVRIHSQNLKQGKRNLKKEYRGYLLDLNTGSRTYL